MHEQGGTEPTVPPPDRPPDQLPDARPDPAPAAPVEPVAPLVPWAVPPSAPGAPPPATTPLVAWARPPSSPPGGAAGGGYAEAPPFTVGALLSDTFARYGADVLRLFLVAIAASAISWIASAASMPAPGSSPFIRPRGFVDVSGILGLASFVLGLVAGSTTLALAEG